MSQMPLSFDDLVAGEYYWLFGFQCARPVVCEFQIRSVESESGDVQEFKSLVSYRRSYEEWTIKKLLKEGVEILHLPRPCKEEAA